MARASGLTRNLTLTEELEKLEQSITLTLQEIDHNFSKAHRTVTASILPLVETYGEHSRTLWDASKFWKQFFESSANVSLSGYEDLVAEDETTADSANETTLGDRATGNVTKSHLDNETTNHSVEGTDADESLFNDDVSGSTPRQLATLAVRTRFSDHESPYELLKREIRGETTTGAGPGPGEVDVTRHTVARMDDADSSLLLHDDQSTTRIPGMSMTPHQSLSQVESAQQPPKDRLLHRVLDKNYRLHTTHHRPPSRVSPLKPNAVGATAWADSPLSSPEMVVPTLRSEVFMTPLPTKRRSAAVVGRTPRAPGISVQTPLVGRKARPATTTTRAHSRQTAAERPGLLDGTEERAAWDSDSDVDFDPYVGISPPKTIQFALPPSKLLQTPAREASKRIVQNILLTAGAYPESTMEDSPSVIKMNEDILNDSF